MIFKTGQFLSLCAPESTGSDLHRLSRDNGITGGRVRCREGALHCRPGRLSAGELRWLPEMAHKCVLETLRKLRENEFLGDESEKFAAPVLRKSVKLTHSLCEVTQRKLNKNSCLWSTLTHILGKVLWPDWTLSTTTGERINSPSPLNTQKVTHVLC